MPQGARGGGGALPISFLTSTYTAVMFLFLLLFSNLNNTFQCSADLTHISPGRLQTDLSPVSRLELAPLVKLSAVMLLRAAGGFQDCGLQVWPDQIP